MEIHTKEHLDFYGVLLKEVIWPFNGRHPFSRLGIESPPDRITIYKKSLLRGGDIIIIRPPFAEENVEVLDERYADLAEKIIGKIRNYQAESSSADKLTYIV